MCWWRRVYFTCRHEDQDVTPPRPIKPCDNAIRTGSADYPNYCSEGSRQKTRRNAWTDAIFRERPCIPCEKREERQRLDQEWNSFMHQTMRTLTVPEVAFYQEQREQIFDSYYWYWSDMQRDLINSCREDIQMKYGNS
ncbi:hypothetical protein K445DRAFT_321991 [Daldinia sp. EC12]|nr:hypothetical protein F4774DRAFT_404938 [Daldinia eschscholtzii]OTB11401.1 hypothetical protein K445DRAFT_321991 [Daldinia sp. EC12]